MYNSLIVQAYLRKFAKLDAETHNVSYTNQL